MQLLKHLTRTNTDTNTTPPILTHQNIFTEHMKCVGFGRYIRPLVADVCPIVKNEWSSKLAIYIRRFKVNYFDSDTFFPNSTGHT